MECDCDSPAQPDNTATISNPAAKRTRVDRTLATHTRTPDHGARLPGMPMWPIARCPTLIRQPVGTQSFVPGGMWLRLVLTRGGERA
jgi:hypothetical protein